MWRRRATRRWDGGKPCAARPSSTSSASANGSSSLAFRTHVRNAEDGPRACRRAGCCEGSRSAKSRGTTRGPADTVFLHVFAKFRRDPLSDPPESHGRMLPHATHGPMATCSGTDRHITDHVRERWTDGVRSTKWVSYAKMCVARVEMSGHEESEACQRGPRPTPRSRLDPTRPPPGAAHVRCHWRVLPYIRPDPVTPGPARPTAGDRARTVAWLLGLRGRATPSGEIRFDLLNYALGSPCQPATTSPAIHRAT